MKINMETFNKLEPGDQAMIFIIARQALDIKGFESYRCISKEYEKELKDNLDKIIEEILAD